MTDAQVLLANIGSNVVALAILIVSWRWRNAGRLLFVLLFLWAGQLNLRTALTRPGVYLDYARWAVPVYRDFILGPFSRHIGLLVSGIALGQLVIAALASLRGRAVTVGLWGATVFLLAIAPLGRGAAFPFSLVTSLAALSLSRRSFPLSLLELAAGRLRRRRTRG